MLLHSPDRSFDVVQNYSTRPLLCIFRTHMDTSFTQKALFGVKITRSCPICNANGCKSRVFTSSMNIQDCHMLLYSEWSLAVHILEQWFLTFLANYPFWCIWKLNYPKTCQKICPKNVSKICHKSLPKNLSKNLQKNL